MKILLATTNAGKRKEMLSALEPMPGVNFVSLEDLNISISVPETGKNYAENALIKAEAYFKVSVIPVIAEDSGMEVSALKGELGHNTRRWGAGEKASDREWLEFFMDRMKTEQDRSARFVCHSVYLDGTGAHHFEGECLGAITETIEGPVISGIPLSAVFKPLGESLVYSHMSEQRKNALSHRGKAMQGLRKLLSQWWTQGESNPNITSGNSDSSPRTLGPRINKISYEKPRDKSRG